ncbi:hypothetical protein AMTR_s00033p00123860, partial [Amborella trichopoda]
GGMYDGTTGCGGSNGIDHAARWTHYGKTSPSAENKRLVQRYDEREAVGIGSSPSIFEHYWG